MPGHKRPAENGFKYFFVENEFALYSEGSFVNIHHNLSLNHSIF